MGRIYILLTSLFFIVLLSCKKEASNGIDGNNSWTVGGNTYTATNVVYGSAGSGTLGSLTADYIGGTYVYDLEFDFYPSIKTTNQKYLISNSRDSNTVTITTIKYNAFLSLETYSSHPSNVYVTASIDSTNKVSASFQGKIWVYRISTPIDSLQLSAGTITKQ